jgi:hypothetical protein
MDYKYIEQLLERYWACETSLQEEEILRTFFRQKEVPAHLMAYKAVFDVQQEQTEATLCEDFDVRMLQLTEGETVKALPLQGRAGRRAFFRPLYQAAGLVALILTIGLAAQESFNGNEKSQQAQYALADSMENPVQEVTPLPEQQAALAAEQVDSMNLTR